jgi:hypothetical protein
VDSPISGGSAVISECGGFCELRISGRLNEFLKEHRKVEEQSCKLQEQGATIARLEQQVAALKITRDSQIAPKAGL